jgi:hypothetical protein
MPIIATQRVCFGCFKLDTRSGELYKRDLRLKLHNPQAIPRTWRRHFNRKPALICPPANAYV